MKKYLSKGSIDLMEIGAKQQGKTLEQLMKDSPAVEGPAPQFSNEKITGDTATVDVSRQGQTVSMPFVKENGEWKIAIDKLAVSMMGGQKAPPTQSAPSTQTAPPTMTTPSTEKNEDEHNDNANH